MIPIQEAIDRISKALERRSGRPWSVTTLKGEGLPEWLRVTTTEDRLCTDRHQSRGMADVDRKQLADLLNLLVPVRFGGLLIPPNCRRMYVDVAEDVLPRSNRQSGCPGDTRCPGCYKFIPAEMVAWVEAETSQSLPYKCADCWMAELNEATA